MKASDLPHHIGARATIHGLPPQCGTGTVWDAHYTGAKFIRVSIAGHVHIIDPDTDVTLEVRGD